MKLLWTFCLTASLLIGCSDDAPDTTSDASLDAATESDTGRDTGPDLDTNPADTDTDTTDDDADADAPDGPADVVDEPDTPDVEPDIEPDIEPDTPVDTGPDLPPPAPIYLTHVQNDRDELWLIDVDTLEITVACEFPQGANYPSITFGLDGLFYGSRQGQFLDRIDPCTCETSYLGPMGFTGVVGITANGVKDWELYGLSHISDILLTLDIESGAGTSVGEGLGIDFGFSGTTWSADIAGLFAINADNDTLYRVDIDTGVAYMPVPMNADFDTVGIEWHPSNSKLYACTDSQLFRIDTVTGEASLMTELDSRCNNLAAPWQPVECLDDLLRD